MVTPQGMVVVGQTDWLDVTKRSLDLALNSRLRQVRRDYNPNDWRSALTAGTRAVPATVPLYAEVGVEVYHADPTGHLVGIVSAAAQATFAAASYATYPGASAGSWGLNGAGSHIDAGVSGEVNCSTFNAGDRVGVLLYRDSSNTPYLRYLLNGRRNVLGYSEEFDNAAWQKLNSATASGQYVRFVTSTSGVQQNVSRCGGVGSKLTFSALLTSSKTTTVYLTLADATDGVPTHTQAFALTADVPTRVTLSATMGAGFGGTLAVQFTGGGVITANTYIRIQEAQVNAGLERDPYQVQRGAAGGYMGHPVAITDTTYHLALTCYYGANTYSLHVDQDDFLYPQTGCQAWGAQARVSADRGGYSREATKLSDSIGALVGTIDADGRAYTSSNSADFGVANDNAPNLSAASGFYYFEVRIETVGGFLGGMVGLAIRDHATGIYSFPGHSATSWGYYGATGQKYNAAAAAAYGNTYTAGDVVGVIWRPSTGGLWFSKNGVVQNAGNPESGTGAAYTNATGDLVPALSAYQSRQRLCTHAREQVYRPSYCTAWDGADQLPEQHYRATLERTPTYRRGFSVWPWNRRRAGGSPISDLELHNTGGRYDGLADADLRDQPVTGYRQESAADLVTRQFYTRADRVELRGTDLARVMLRDRSALLDVHLASAAVLFGYVRVPGVVETGARDFVVSHHPYTIFTVKDGGSDVINWHRLPVTYGAGFRRTVAPTKRVIGYQPVHYDLVSRLTLTNGDFATWAGDNPSSWTVTETAPSNIVTQSGTKARFVRANPGSTVKIVGTVTGTPSAVNFLRIVVSSYVSGGVDVLFYAAGVLKDTEYVGCGNGEYWIPLEYNGGAAPFTVEIAAAAGTDLAIDDVEFWTATARNASGSTIVQAATEVLQYQAGFTASDWTYDNHSGFAWYSSPVGMWSGNRPLLREALETLLDALLGGYYVDANDVLHLAQLPVPSASISAATIAAGDILELSVEDDTAPGLTDFYQVDENYAPHAETEIDGTHYTTDPTLAAYLRTPATDFRRETLTTYGGSALSTYYSHARNGAPQRLALTRSGASVISQLIDIQGHWLVRRRFFKATVRRSAIDARRPSDVVTITWPRFGLSAGKPVAIVDIESSFTGPTADVLFWG
jgi:hypothetical protein